MLIILTFPTGFNNLYKNTRTDSISCLLLLPFLKKKERKENNMWGPLNNILSMFCKRVIMDIYLLIQKYIYVLSKLPNLYKNQPSLEYKKLDVIKEK